MPMNNNTFRFSRLGLVLLLCFSWVRIAHGQVYIAPYEKVYEDLRYLQTAGYLRQLDLNQQPLTDADLSSALRAERQSESYRQAKPLHPALMQRMLNAYAVGDTNLVQKIKSRVQDWLFRKERRDPVFRWGLRWQVTGEFNDGMDWYPLVHTCGSLQLTPQVSVANVMALDPYATGNPEYIGKEWRGLSGYTEQAYLTWQGKYLRLIAGRCYLVNGPGRMSSLLFSGTARPLDQLRLEYRGKQIGLQTVTAQLDQIGNARRYLTAHRLSFYLNNFSLALSEAVLYGGDGQSVEFAYLNPFLLLHGEQMNGPGLAGNTLGTIEGGYFGRNYQVYAEVLIDDIQFDKKVPGDLEPNEFGIILGGDWADPFDLTGWYLGLEYAALTNRTYKTTNAYEWYRHRNAPIGYALGSDLDRWNLLIKKYYRQWQFIGELDYLRRGEGEWDKAWDSPWDTCTVAQGYDEPFPTGRVERTFQKSVEVRWMPDYRKYLFARISQASVENVKHTRKESSDLLFSIGMYYALGRE